MSMGATTDTIPQATCESCGQRTARVAVKATGTDDFLVCDPCAPMLTVG